MESHSSSGPRRGPLARSLAAAIALALIGLASGPAAGQTSERQRAEAMARRATERMRALQREAEQLARQERTILGELRRLEVDRGLKAAEVSRLDAELAAANADLASTTAEIARLEQQVTDNAPVVSARLAALYKMGRPGYYRLLLHVENIGDVGRAYRTVSAMARIDRDRIAEHQRRLATLRAARATAAQRAGDIARLRGAAAAARVALERAIQSRNARVRAIDERRDLTAQLTGELQDAQRRLQASLADLAAGRPASATLPIHPFRGDLPWPARGRVLGGFGRQTDPRFGTATMRNGLEIGAQPGSPVLAVHDGRVAFAGPFVGFGNLVIVDHGEEHFSLYGHLEDIAVQHGEPVERQRQLGTVGHTPTGRAALYFELRIDGRPVDPLQWLKR